MLGPRFQSTPFPTRLPAYTHRCPDEHPPRKRRRRRRGKRSGFAAHLKRALLRECGANSRGEAWTRGRCLGWSIYEVPQRINLHYLRPLRRATQTETASLLKVALVNDRSLWNKTYILNDFFTFHALDILCVTETWVRPGELSTFSKLVPQDCNFLNSPRLSGHGGGLASVFRNIYHC